MFGQTKPAIPSRFLDELGRDCVQREDVADDDDGPWSSSEASPEADQHAGPGGQGPA